MKDHLLDPLFRDLQKHYGPGSCFTYRDIPATPKGFFRFDVELPKFTITVQLNSPATHWVACVHRFRLTHGDLINIPRAATEPDYSI